MKKVIIILLTIVTLCGCNTYHAGSDVNNIPAAKNIEEKNTVQDIESSSKELEEPAVLYRGIPLDISDQNIDVISGGDELYKKSTFAKYEREYYLYANGSLLGKAFGKIEERGYDYYWQVAFPSEYDDYEVAISQSYNPYPRKSVNCDSDFPNKFNTDAIVLTEINSKFDVHAKVKELCSVDLDGDNRNEYIIFVFDEENNFFAKCLLDSEYKITSYLMVYKVENEYFYSNMMQFNLLDSGEIIDVDNDGVMEIVMKIPAYEGFVFKVFKYKNGIFEGDYITECSIQP